MKREITPEPVLRGRLRMWLGVRYFRARRWVWWHVGGTAYARRRTAPDCPHLWMAHATPLVRRLRDVDLWMQENKVTNLRLASARVNGIVLRPGQTFSYWYLIGRPTARKGYLPGMLLRNGRAVAGVGGGLCQLSNLIFWMTLHTPLTVTERHRHGYDVFPDSDRTQPFGSGATCFYPYGDLMIRNDTADDYQLLVTVGKHDLIGEWRCSAAPECRYEIVERDHEMRAEYWGGYTRHNVLWQQRFDADGVLLDEKPVVRNDAIMMYSPYLEEGGANE